MAYIFSYKYMPSLYLFFKQYNPQQMLQIMVLEDILMNSNDKYELIGNLIPL